MTTLKRRAPAPTARRVAYDALLRVDHDGAYANLLVPEVLGSSGASGLESRDRRFVTELVYGTTRMRRACDFAVDRFLLRAPAPELRTLLRLGAYQLLEGGVAPHAAVSATVDLAPPRLRGVTNAVLRRVAAEPPRWPDDATRLSYPDWIVRRLVTELGEAEAIATLEHMNRRATATEREDGYVQDLASQWVADAVGAQAGERIADLCAAPGGKATRLGRDVAPDGLVVAADIRPARARLVAANAARLGRHELAVVVGDGAAPPLRPGVFDHVLVDAPCSGLGALRRRPDARWRITEEAIENLVPLQGALLSAAQDLVRPGGVVTYSVCTLTAAESVDHDAGGLLDWEALAPPPAPWQPYGRGARLLPRAADADGMVVLRFRRPA